MAPIPGEPHKSKPQELALGDGRKIKLKLPGMPPATPEADAKPDATTTARDDAGGPASTEAGAAEA